MRKQDLTAPAFQVYQPDDLGKKWFVYWYEGSKRLRKYGDINSFPDRAGRALAAEKLIEQLRLEHQRRVTRSEETLRQFLEGNAGKWRQRTREQYLSCANVLFEHLAGQALTQARLDAFLQHIEQHRHPTTYNKYVAILKRLMRGAGLAFRFPSEKMKAHATPARYFQAHQARLLLSRIDEQDAELGLFVRFVYYCFLRPAELRRLKAGDVLLEEGEIRVPGAISKNGKTQHVVLPDAFRPSLEVLWRLAPGDYVFPSPVDKSKPLSKNVMYRRHRAILDQLNFGEGYTLYSWKHTGAVAAAKAGIPLKELQLQLRHHSLDETDGYLRQMGVKDLGRLRVEFPGV